MAGLNSWLSPHVMYALGWALIHSLWQCLGLAALAAAMMALSRRSSIRYLIGVGAVAVMLVVPVGTFFVLMRAAAPDQIVPAQAIVVTDLGALLPAGPKRAVVLPAASGSLSAVAASSTNIGNSLIGPLEAGVSSLPAILPWLVGAWLLGVVFFSLRFAGGFLLLERRCRQSTAPSSRILGLCRELQRQLGLNRAIRYLECGWLQAPAVIGWFRPIVLLPVTALTGLTEEQLRAVIAHELAHIRRLDAFVNLFQVLVETLLFYHPAVWWLNKRIRAERELCCDVIAVSVTGNRLEYARALTLMAGWTSAPMLAMAANRGPLTTRILHVLDRKPFGAGQHMLGLTGGMLFLAAALVAADTLFGMAYPVSAAHAKDSVKAVLPSNHVAANRMARQILPASKPEAVNVTPATDTQETVAPDPVTKNSPAEKLIVPSIDLSRLLPNDSSVTPVVIASNAPPAAAQSDEAAASTIPRSAQRSPTAETLNDQTTIYHCRNTSVFGGVLSSKAIQMQGFTCLLEKKASLANGADDIRLGSCPVASTSFAHKPGCKWDVTMNVQLADPADASKMQPGKLVRLGGEFQIMRRRQTDYLTVENARVLFVDFFWSGAPSLPGRKTPPSPPNLQPFYNGGAGGYYSGGGQPAP